MPTDFPKQYDPHSAQEKWLKHWEQQGYNHSRPDQSKEPFCIVIPPPNVTGALHMGHALNNTLQDVLIRWRRMQGYNALYMPGSDHAGIATQAVVEKRILEEEGKTRREIGREKLVERIWKWKDQYETRILEQLHELGCSCDWQRTRFTLDPICVRAVRHTFFKMFRDGFIYRGKRLVNWDTHLQTSVADDETYTEDVKSGFWTFKYPVKNSDEFIHFSTTRPETMLGDTAVCVHPNDERYQHLIGKTVTIPLVDREIPIIADGQLADPELGTGCVKVTPAHDPNDYACGLRNNLPMINILNPDGTINENGGKYDGLDRYEARKKVIEDMEKLGLHEGHAEREIPLKYSDRSKTPIEPYLSDQWFVAMGDRNGQPGLAQVALDAVTSERVKFFPSRYAKGYLDWLGEKRDWCISRQLWWGHRIPIWYSQCPEAELKRAFAGRDDVFWRLDEENGRWMICALEEDLPADALGEKYPLEQDPDVLDTWFSSQLWPHSTMGWPKQTAELAYYYPTNVLVTSRDIITLWVVRMVLAGLYNTGKIPFHHVYIHTKILDGFGMTMSKSKGNGIDPLDIIHFYGTDALRYGIVNIASESQDSRLPVFNICPHCEEQIAVKHEHMYMRTRQVKCPKCKKPFRPGGPWPTDDKELPTAKQAAEQFREGRNFANKLWNAARFILMNLEGYTPQAFRLEELPIEDRWMLSRLAAVTNAITESLEAYHFSEVADALYKFIWSEFCDWYIEMSKGRLRVSEPAASAPRERQLAQRMLAGVLDYIIRLAHPVMPFVTETIWQALNEAAFERGLPAPQPAEESAMIASWPVCPDEWRDPAMEQRIDSMQKLIRSVREVRNRPGYNINPKSKLNIFVRCEKELADDFRALSPFIESLARVGEMQAGPDIQKPPQSVSHVQPDFEVFISWEGRDIAAEIQRGEKQRAEKNKHLASTEAKLANENFLKKAPADKVQEERDRAEDLKRQIESLKANLAELRQ